MTPANALARPFVAREPIVNRRMRVLGCQLKFAAGRPSAGEALAPLPANDPEELRVLARGKPAFLSVTRDDLFSSATADLHPGVVVLELAGDLPADTDVREACADLHDRGYRFSIDDFHMDAPAAPLLDFASYLKVRAADGERDDSRARLVATCATGMSAVVATGVHTINDVEAAARDGLKYFQGFVLHEAGNAAVPSANLRPPLLRLLKALNNSRLSIGQFEDLVRRDPALCYRILQTVNSAAFGLRSTVYSLEQAILLVGRDAIRRWASLWIMAGLGADSEDEIVVTANVRARLCEVIVTPTLGPDAGGEAFLLGMCSAFDAMFGRPMPEIAAELPLEPESRDVLCGGPGPFRDVLDCVRAYERGDWAGAAAAAGRGHIDINVLPGAFFEALRWSRELDNLIAQIVVAPMH